MSQRTLLLGLALGLVFTSSWAALAQGPGYSQVGGIFVFRPGTVPFGLRP